MTNRKVYVIDTNIILNGMHHIINISEEGMNLIVIPETVLIELEDKKKLPSDIGYHARAFARFIAAGTTETEQRDGHKILKCNNDNIDYHIVAKESYENDISEHNIAESRDKRIIEVAKSSIHLYPDCDVKFLSVDVYARTFALLDDLKVETLQDDKAETPDFEFVKALDVDSSLFNSLDLSKIELYDENYSNENFCYRFLSSDGNSTYGVIINKIIHIIEHDDFKGLLVKGANLKQKFFLKAMLTNLYDILVIDAKAGSGKTLMSISAAMRLIDIGLYDKIIYVRNSIESIDKGADVGYLSGNDEKFRIYNMALHDTLGYIAKNKKKRKSDKSIDAEANQAKIDDIIEAYQIEMLWPGEARGRTLSNAIVILDEWQNSSVNTTQLILSRLDESCMAVVIGSNRQIDNLYLNKYNNGLTALMKQTKIEHDEINMFAIELDKAVRGKFAEFTERIFENKL